jgi:hypothetical protein
MLTLTRPSRKRVPARNLSRRALQSGRTFYDNTLDAFNVQLWANTSLAILFENMVMAQLVNRDFEQTLAQFGDTVNTRKPGEFTAKRKTNADAVTVQNATAVNIPVKLNQLWHVSYLVKDGEESIAFKSIIDEFLRPALIAEARAIDHVLASQVYQFQSNSAGRLLFMDENNAKNNVLTLRQVMNLNKAWTTNRNLILTPANENSMLRAEEFTDANRVGDDGTALREASLGRKLGFDILMAQNQPYVAPVAIGTLGGTRRLGAVNNAAGYVIGDTTFTVDGLAAAITAGTFITIAGDDTPLQVVSTVGGATPTSITVFQGLKSAVADNAVITVYNTGAVSGAYTVDATTLLGYGKEITISGMGAAPQIGQQVTFGSDNAHIYAVIDVNGLVGITLDRPIEANIADTAKVNLGPAGSYNFGFHPNALTMATRPLALPRAGTGALAGRATWDGITLRVVITYDGNKQGHLVTIDILMGVKVIEPALGSVLYG